MNWSAGVDIGESTPSVMLNNSFCDIHSLYVLLNVLLCNGCVFAVSFSLSIFIYLSRYYAHARISLRAQRISRRAQRIISQTAPRASPIVREVAQQ